MTRHFEDETFTIESVFGRLQVTVTGEALDLLREGSYFEDGRAVIVASRGLIEQVATMKFEAGESSGDYAVHITAGDLRD